MENLQDKIKQVMAHVFGLEVHQITDEASPGAVEAWDSLRHMNLIVALEEEFDVRFPDEAIEALMSLKLIEYHIREIKSKDR